MLQIFNCFYLVPDFNVHCTFMLQLASLYLGIVSNLVTEKLFKLCDAVEFQLSLFGA